jgi:hypothetical protein
MDVMEVPVDSIGSCREQDSLKRVTFHGTTFQKRGMMVYEIEQFSISDGVFLLAYVDVNIDSSAYNPIIFHDYTLGALVIVDT